MENVTYSYVDITFCYATVFTGEITIPADHPLFSSAKVIRNQSDYTLRLYLKKQGGFYGWNAYYNEANQLCFSFLKPATVAASDNAYGVDLTGVKIVVDAGHNGAGIDCGAIGVDNDPQKNYEAGRNLNLALKVKAELESIGATVILTRENNQSRMTYQERISFLRAQNADFCLSIHHDSSTSTSPNGFSAYHYYAFAQKAAELIRNYTYNSGIYNKTEIEKWHYFYLARTSVCPVVLTENGFISSPTDFAGIASDSVNAEKARAITKGIVDFFKGIQ